MTVSNRLTRLIGMTTTPPSLADRWSATVDGVRAEMAAQGTLKGPAGALMRALLRLLEAIALLLADFQAGRLPSPPAGHARANGAAGAGAGTADGRDGVSALPTVHEAEPASAMTRGARTRSGGGERATAPATADPFAHAGESGGRLAEGPGLDSGSPAVIAAKVRTRGVGHTADARSADCRMRMPAGAGMTGREPVEKGSHARDGPAEAKSGQFARGASCDHFVTIVKRILGREDLLPGYGFPLARE